MQSKKFTLTLEQLQKFHLEAFKQGYESKNVCGSLGKLNEPNKDLTIRALVLSFVKR